MNLKEYFKTNKTISVGVFLRNDKEDCIGILCQTGMMDVLLINLKTGNRWNDSVLVKNDCTEIKEEEMNQKPSGKTQNYDTRRTGRKHSQNFRDSELC